MSDDRAAALAAIAKEVSVCTLCGLHKGRTKSVPGAGNLNAEIMFIGEGPGYNEDKQGLPFVGQSGTYLTELLTSIGLKRDDVFIGNVVKCRPPDNRDPLPGEIAACKSYLDRQIEIINPLVIATLGRHSMARYFPGGKITQIHGKPKYEDGRAYYPMFHPAFVLRNRNYEQQMADDFKQLLEVVAKVKELRSGGQKPPPPKDDPPLKQLSLF